MIKINTKIDKKSPFQVKNYQLQPTLESSEYWVLVFHIEKLCYKVGIQWTIVQIEWNYILGPAKVPHIGSGWVLIRLAIVLQFVPIVYGISIWGATYGGNNLVIARAIYVVSWERPSGTPWLS